MRIYELCRAMGLQRYARWTKAERTVLNRYLRALYAGRFPQLRLAANACAREMQRLFGRTGMQAEGDSSSAGRHSAEAVHHAMFDTANRLGLPRHKGALASLEQRLYEKYARATVEGRYVDALQAATACRREASRIYARIGALSPLHVRRLAPRSLAATQRGILKAVARLSVQYPGRRWLPAEMRIFGSWLRWYSRYHHVRRLQPLTQAANGLSDDLAKAGFRRTPRACESRLLIMRSKMMYA